MCEEPPGLVLFDLGDVLADYDPAPRIAEYAQRSGLDREDVLRRLGESGFSVDCDRGRYDADQIHAEIERRLGVRFARDELVRLQAAAFRLRPGVMSLAREVATRSQIGILTNNSPLLELALPVHFSSLCEHFDPILFSWRFGHVKPAEELFERVTSQFERPASEIFFVDDQESHVAAARRVGWEALRFESQTQLCSALAERGLVDATHR